MRSASQHPEMRRVLVVAYVFPPAGGAGVQRVTKFVRYLPEFGWDCSVLTAANPSVPVFDESLEAEVPESTVIRRARTLEPGYALKNAVSAGNERADGRGPGLLKRTVRSSVRAVGNALLQPDAQILWYPRAVREGMRLLQELRHDAVFVTAPPFSAFLVGLELSRRSGLPLIVDYRDEWGISNRFQENRQKSRFSCWLQGLMQRRVLRRASEVIATTGRSAESLQDTVCNAGGTAPVSCIYNGYDASDLERLLDDRVHPSEPFSDGSEQQRDRSTLRLAYVGTLWNLTSIEPFVDALQRLSASSPELAKRIELVVAGRRTAEQEQVLDRLERTPCTLIRKGYVDHHEALRIMQSADAQCLLLSDVPEAGRVVPAKTFEYLALKRPILFVGPEGEVSGILSEFPQADWFLPSDAGGIVEYLRQRLRTGSETCGSGLSPSATVGSTSVTPEQFERRCLTSELATLLNRACGAPDRSDLKNPARSPELEGVHA